MAQNKPAGFRSIWLVFFLVGAVLVAIGFGWPSIHSVWEIPVGIILVITMFGKMTVR